MTRAAEDTLLLPIATIKPPTTPSFSPSRLPLPAATTLEIKKYSLVERPCAGTEGLTVTLPERAVDPAMPSTVYSSGGQQRAAHTWNTTDRGHTRTQGSANNVFTARPIGRARSRHGSRQSMTCSFCLAVPTPLDAATTYSTLQKTGAQDAPLQNLLQPLNRRFPHHSIKDRGGLQ